MALDLELTPTTDLIRSIKRNSTERAIGRTGCLLSILLATTACIAIFCFTTIHLFLKLYIGFFGSAFLSLFAYSLANYLADFRLRPRIRELNRRFGRLPVFAYERYCGQTNGSFPMVCIFHGATLPYGEQFWGSIWFGGEGVPTLVRTVSREIMYKKSPDPWDDFHYSEREIPAPKAMEIHSLIHRTKGIGKVRIPDLVMDGFPINVAVVFGGGSKPTRISANLCGLSSEQEEDDRVKLLRSVASVVCEEEQAAS